MLSHPHPLAENPAATLKRAFVVGPTQPPVNGFAILVDTLAEDLPHHGWTVSRIPTTAPRPLHLTGKIHMGNAFAALRAWGSLWRLTAWHRGTRQAVVYLSVSEAGLGLIRDLGLLLIAHYRQLPVVVHVIGGRYDKLILSQPKIVQAFLRRIFSRVKLGIVVADSLRRCLECVLPPERVRVVPNGIPPIPAKPPGRSALPDEIHVTYLSAASEGKGLIDFCKAAVIVADRADRPTRFVVAGTPYPQDVAKARRLVRGAALSDRITFRGTVHGKQKLQVLREADIFVFPSRLTEAHPLAVLEAMMVGLPVVSTDVGAMQETLPPEASSQLVPPANPKELAGAILSLMADPIRRGREGRANRERALERFSVSNYVVGVSAILSEALSRRQQGPSGGSLLTPRC